MAMTGASELGDHQAVDCSADPIREAGPSFRTSLRRRQEALTKHIPEELTCWLGVAPQEFGVPAGGAYVCSL